jgi:hypothetical protein
MLSSYEGAMTQDVVDITHLIKRLRFHLNYPESVLVQPSSFSLQDAMAAARVMDRKMDCCEVPAPRGLPGVPILIRCVLGLHLRV